VAIAATDLALLHLSDEYRQRDATAHKTAGRFELRRRIDVIELQDPHVGLAAVDARVGCEIVDEELEEPRIFGRASYAGFANVVRAV
jgi:hypothetical protein